MPQDVGSTAAALVLFPYCQLSGPLPEHAEGPVLTVWAAFTEL